MLRAAFQRLVLARAPLCFVVMCLGFAVFGLGTLNLFLVMSANLELIGRLGWTAIMEGAALQLVELVLTLGLSMGGYIVFKACEHALVARLGGNSHSEESKS
jgi:hypothetical protein